MQRSPKLRNICASIERKNNPSFCSILLRLHGGSQRDRGLAREQEECECLLQIQTNGRIGVAEIADGDVLSNVQGEIATTRRQYKSAGDGRSPDDFIFDQSLNMLQNWIPVVARLSECGISIGAEQHRVRTV